MLFLLFVFAISLAIAVWFTWRCMRIVRVRQAIIIYNRFTGDFHRMVVGPKTALVLPFEDILVLDLTMRPVRIYAANVITFDLAAEVSLDVFYAIDPSLFQPNKLNSILPILARGVEDTVRSNANYVLRSLSASHTTDDLVREPARRSHLEDLFQKILQDWMQSLGVRIHNVRLLYNHPQSMIDAQVAAARTKLAAQARADALEMISAALGPDRSATDILPLELMQQTNHKDTMTAVNLSLPGNAKVNELDPLTMHWMLTPR